MLSNVTCCSLQHYPVTDMLIHIVSIHIIHGLLCLYRAIHKILLIFQYFHYLRFSKGSNITCGTIVYTAVFSEQLAHIQHQKDQRSAQITLNSSSELPHSNREDNKCLGIVSFIHHQHCLKLEVGAPQIIFYHTLWSSKAFSISEHEDVFAQHVWESNFP